MLEREHRNESQWHEAEMSEVELKDGRLNRRCIELLGQFSMNPAGAINESCEDWAETKAAYRFFANKKVTPARILAPHQKQTQSRMGEEKRVLAIQDTTYLNYTHHPKTEGLGEIGNKQQKQRGFGLHSTLAMTEEGQPLGLLTQEFFIRPIGEPAHRPEELRLLPIAEKESYRWLKALTQTVHLTPEGVEVITVCDREADIYELFVLVQQIETGLLVRASSNRVLQDAEAGKLWPHLARQPVAGHFKVRIAGNSKRKARTAKVTVRYTEVTLKPPWRPAPLKMSPVTLNAILVSEEHPPAHIKDPIEWLLLTNSPLLSFEDARQVIQWYCFRWQIEIFHKILKSGCNVEASRLRFVSRLHKFITLSSILAWRLLWISSIQHTDPDLPCSSFLTTIEWHALFIRIHKHPHLPPSPPSARQAIRWIAQLGGFLARSQDGHPGVTYIWRGWQRLQDIASTCFILHLFSQSHTYG